MLENKKILENRNINVKIREALRAANYTQEDVSSAIGVSRPFFNRIVTKKISQRVNPSNEIILKLATFFEIDSDLFLNPRYTADDVYTLVGNQLESQAYKNKTSITTKEGRIIKLSRTSGSFRPSDLPSKRIACDMKKFYEKKKIQPWDVTLDWELDPWLSGVIRYLFRHRHKNGVQDIRKAIYYLKFVEENYSKIEKKYYVCKEKEY